MQGNDIRIILSGILVSVMLLFGCPDFLHQKDAYVALTYHLFHANIFHLAANLLSVWLIFRRGVRYGWQTILLAYVIAVAFLPNVSGITHIVSFMLGCACAAFKRILNGIASDYRRASYHQ